MMKDKIQELRTILELKCFDIKIDTHEIMIHATREKSNGLSYKITLLLDDVDIIHEQYEVIYECLVYPQGNQYSTTYALKNLGYTRNLSDALETVIDDIDARYIMET